MRQLHSLLTLAPSLLLSCLTSTSAHAPSYTHHSDYLDTLPDFRHQIPQFRHHSGDPRPLLTRWRDRVLQAIWRIPQPSYHLPGNSRKASASTASPPPTLLSRYGGDLVLRFELRSAEEAQALSDAIDVLLLDVWEFTPDWVDIRLSKAVVPSLLGLLPASLQHAHTPLMHDLAQAIYESYPSLAFSDPSSPPPNGHRTFSPSLRPSSSETNIFFQSYQPLSVITPWMRLLKSLFPSHVRLINIGISYEGRDIPAFRVGVHPTNSEKPSGPRKTIIVAGGSHAREWISVSTVTYVAYSFITGYGKSRLTTKLLENFDWIFIPTLNPDGYAYTWENDRLWRKNRQQTSLRFCKGLDLDRSWGFEWDDEASKSNPCSESFSGEEAFEGVEARRLADWVRNETVNNNASFIGFLDLHSYSQQVLYPYSYSCIATPPSLENLQELAIGLAKAIRLTSGEIYGVTSACEGSVTFSPDQEPQPQPPPQKQNPIHPRIETGGGSALDWFYHEAQVPYTYQIKLRDTGSYGFLLPANRIVPTGKEATAALTYFGNWLLGNKGIEAEAGKGMNERIVEEGNNSSSIEEEEKLEEDEVVQGELKRRRR